MNRPSVRSLAIAGAVLAGAAATAAVGSTDRAAARPVAAADTVGGRYIVRLAEGAARANLLAEVTGAPLTLEARHERAVRGLRSIHEASYADAVDAMNVARAVGTVREIDRLWIVNAIVAELDPAAVAALEADPAVAEVVPDRRLTPGMRPEDRPTPVGRATVQDPSDEIALLNVPQVWAEGITGKGAIVANVDTGVNADDETFGDRWRGYVAGSDASWYAPIPLTVYPEDDGSIFGVGHGSATMGLLTGGEESYGVAFDATWMAGDIFEDEEGFVSNALKVLEWMTDPDGDPGTNSDVPDVVNNSYGLEDLDDTGRVRCDPIFNDAIDALEAAGAIVIWSAGNIGQTGVTSPANRADGPVNAFAVGGVDLQGNPVPSSGRGPSRCGGPHQVKPEVVAPGEGVLTRNRFNQFVRLTGTSFATPMVGGVLALMRSKNPTITPEAAKTILLETARDLASEGNDNATGFGLVDAAEAVARVQRPGQPLARIVGYGTPDTPGKLAGATLSESLILRPGGAHSLRPLLSNHGPALGAGQATLSSPTSGVTVTRATIPLEAAETGEFFGPAEGDAFTISLASSVPPGTRIVLDLAVQGGSIGPFRMIVPAGDPISGDFATHDAGRTRLTVTNFGGLGYYTGLHQGGFVLEGDGFRFPQDSPNWLFHGSLLVGTGATRLSDDIPYGEDTQNSSDWIPLFGAPIQVAPVTGGERITAQYDDRRAIRPLGIEVRQESFAFDDAGRDDFIVVRYSLTNREDRCLPGLRAGLFADWDLPDQAGAPAETAGWIGESRLGFFRPSRTGQPWLGIALLDDHASDQISYSVVEREAVANDPLGNPVGDREPKPARAPDAFGGEFSDAEKWNALSSGLSGTIQVNTPQDLYQILGVGPFGLGTEAVHTIGVGLVAAADSAGLVDAAARARTAYAGLPPVPSTSGCPSADVLTLRQNYPNPFRVDGETTIEFDVPPANGNSPTVRLAVYDVMGRRVRDLFSGQLQGAQAVTWNGRDERGVPVPAGVYVIRLVAGGQERSVRALVLP